MGKIHIFNDASYTAGVDDTCDLGSSSIQFKDLYINGKAYIDGLGESITFDDAVNIIVNATTGTKIGTATTQKLGFFNATPVVQQGATTDLGTTLSNLGLRAAGTAYPITTSGAVALSGTTALNTKITTYNSIATEGYGVPAVVDLVSLTAQTADITTTNFTNAGTAGLYRVNYVLQDTAADLTAGILTLTIAWTDGAGATTHTNTQALTGVGRASGVIFVQVASGNLTYAVSHSGIFGTAAYALHMICERLN